MQKQIETITNTFSATSKNIFINIKQIIIHRACVLLIFIYKLYVAVHLKALLLGNQITHDDKVFNVLLLWSQYEYENICSIKTRITHIYRRMHLHVFITFKRTK